MSSMRAELRRNFVAGILIALPTTVTVFILWWFFLRVIKPVTDMVARPLVLLMVPDGIEETLGLESVVLWNLMGLVILFVLIVFLGVITRNIFGRKLIVLAEKILSRIPIVRKIYLGAQQIGEAFLGEKRTSFSSVVLFEYPRRGLYTLGLVSGNAKGEVQVKTGEKVLNVFVPTTPNPTSGFLILVPEKDTIALEMGVAEALKLLISGGAVVPGVSAGNEGFGENDANRE